MRRWTRSCKLFAFERPLLFHSKTVSPSVSQVVNCWHSRSVFTVASKIVASSASSSSGVVASSPQNNADTENMSKKNVDLSQPPPIKGLLSSAKKPKKFTPIHANPLARWSRGLKAWRPAVCGSPTTLTPSPSSSSTVSSTPPSPPSATSRRNGHHEVSSGRRLVVPIAVGLEGCNKAFNATNALRTSLYFGCCAPPTFMGAKSASDILSLQKRGEGSDAQDGEEKDATRKEGDVQETEDARGGNVNCGGCSSNNLLDGDASPTMLYGPFLPPTSIAAYAAATAKSFSPTREDTNGSSSHNIVAASSSLSEEEEEGWLRRLWPTIALENYTERCVSIHTARMTDAWDATATRGQQPPPHGNGNCDRVTAAVNSNGEEGDNDHIHQKQHCSDDSHLRGLCILMGDENKGVSEARLASSALVIYVPQYGTISSLNVVTTLGLALFYTWMDLVCPQNRELISSSTEGESLSSNATAALSPMSASAVNGDAVVAAALQSPLLTSENVKCGDGVDAAEGVRTLLLDYFSAFQKDLPMVAEGSSSSAPAVSPSVIVRDGDAACAENKSGGEHGGADGRTLVPWDGETAWNNIRPGHDRVDSRPIHPLFYNMSDTVIGESYGRFYRTLEATCGPFIASMVEREVGFKKSDDGDDAHDGQGPTTVNESISLHSLLPCALYENDFDQRNLGGLIRNANAFMCPRVFYVGKRKINIKGAVGCNHYTPPQYLGKFREVEDGARAEELTHKKAVSKRALRRQEAEEAAVDGADNAAKISSDDAFSNVKRMLAETGRSLWLLSCDHEAFYRRCHSSNGEVGNDDSSLRGRGVAGEDVDTDASKKFANCYSTSESIEAYERLLKRSMEQRRMPTAFLQNSGDEVTREDFFPFSLNLTDSELSIRQKLIYYPSITGGTARDAAPPLEANHHAVPSNTLGIEAGGVVMLIPQEGKLPHHQLLDLCRGIIYVLPRQVPSAAVDEGAAGVASSSSPSSPPSAVPPFCRGLPSQVASGIAFHRLTTSCAPCLKL